MSTPPRRRTTGPEAIIASRPALLRWYRAHRRDLPWRRSADPYAIWVSEVMLQQTRVEAVVPYYERFLERFPDVATLATSPEDDVLAAWSGLGYYRRARALREGAIAVMDRHGGDVPDDPDALRALPGVGRYTAGAIASIAFDRPEPILDGNVRRVLARLLGPAGDDGTDADRDRLLWSLAGDLARGPSPGDLNQALMELGATACAPRAPRCERCPVATVCAGHASGTPDRWPAAQRKQPTVTVRVGVAVVQRSGKVLLERPAADSPLRGRWDLPARELDGALDIATALRDALHGRHGMVTALGPRAATITHGILARRLLLDVHPGRVERGGIGNGDRLRWVDPRALDDVAVSGATRKVLDAVGIATGDSRTTAGQPRTR